MILIKTCLYCGKNFDNSYTRKDRINRPSKGLEYCSQGAFSKRKFCSQVCLGQNRKGEKRPPFSEIWKKRMGISRKGKKHTDKTKKYLSEQKRIYYGHGNHPWNYNGGIYESVRALRKTYQYQTWRKSVIKRDNYTCVWCRKNNCKLDVDHIKPFALYPKFRFSLDNGRTLCINCHKKTDTYGGRKIYNFQTK